MFKNLIGGERSMLREVVQGPLVMLDSPHWVGGP